MERPSIDWKSLAIGFLLGACLILLAAREQGFGGPAGQYEITTGGSTWVMNTTTGDVWQLNGEQNTSKYIWVYAGRPPGTDATTRSPGT